MIVLYFILFLSIILECFPISSSGNIVFLTALLEQIINGPISKDVLIIFDYISHGAIALTVGLFFFPRWIIFLKQIRKTMPILLRVCCAGIITELITVFFWIITSKINFSVLYLSIGFLITSLLLWSLRFISSRKRMITYNVSNAWILGCAQGVALLPGISRFGTTFVVARWLGFTPKKSFELSFLIAWPINVAAFFLGIYKLYDHQMLYLLNLQVLLVMLIGSSVALFCFCLVETTVYKKSFWVFSYYTGILAIITLLMHLIS